jgi:hypothetical protein
MNKLLFITLLSIIFSSCVSVQEVSNVVQLTQNHQRIAVMPIKATVERKIWMTPEKYQDLCNKKSEEIQSRVYRHLAYFSRTGRMAAEVMAPEEVKSMLFGIGFPNQFYSNTDLCSLLHVDAIIWGNIDIKEPVNEATALALSNNTWLAPVTNYVRIDLKLYDLQTDTEIWNAFTSRSGQLGSLKKKMQMDVCRRVSKNMPYNIKKRRYKKAYQNML